jgi:hypothetical protein
MDWEPAAKPLAATKPRSQALKLARKIRQRDEAFRSLNALAAQPEFGMR